jgi:rod shape-determining protein MreD
MFEKIIIFLIIFFAVLLQMSVFPNIFFLGVSPNLAMDLVIFWVVYEGFESAFLKVILTGFILDLAVFWPIGINIIIFSTIAFLISIFSKRLFAFGNWRTIILILFIAIGTAINEVGTSISFRAIEYLKGIKESGSMFFILSESAFFKELFLNILFFFLVSFLVIKIEKFLNLYKNKKNPNYV